MKRNFLQSRLLPAAFALSFLALPLQSQAQEALPSDTAFIKKVYDYELEKGGVYTRLNSLCTEVGGRLSGSPEAARAVVWAEKVMRAGGFDSVYKQPVMVPHWVRGEKESASFVSGGETTSMAVCALGGSVASPSAGVSARIVEVHSLAELQALKPARVKGRIVFFNGAFDQRFFSADDAYGKAVGQRVYGATAAASLGAVGVLVRSMSTIIDDYPHTGVMVYREGSRRIAACAISTLAAERLAAAFKKDSNLVCRFHSSCRILPDAPSFNVVAELRGSEKPSDVITVGGHLDSWDIAQGAQDDGAGVMQALEVLEIYKACHYRPKHTIRAVFFMNEENGTRGGLEYARLAKKAGENCLAALESDGGGFTPRGFTLGASRPVLDKMMSWEKLFRNYGSGWFKPGGEGGSDIEPLKDQAKVLIGLMPDSQRYFDTHHTARDRMDRVNARELKLGAASMASLLYLVDHYGLE